MGTSTTTSISVSLPVTFVSNPAAVTDIQTYLITQVAFNTGLGLPMGTGDTSLTLAFIPAGLPGTGVLLIDSELISYTGVQGSVISGLTRAATLTTPANATIAASHNANAPIYFLTYPSFSAWVKTILDTQLQSIETVLNSTSVLIGTFETAIQTNQAQIATALSSALQ